MNVRRCMRLTSGATLIGAGLLHLGWSVGLSWPAKSREALFESINGREKTPSAGVLAGLGAGLVGGGVLASGAGRYSRLSRLGRCVLSQVLLARGLGGLLVDNKKIMGQIQDKVPLPEVLDPEHRSDRFLDLQRRVYVPVLLSLSALVTLGNIGRGHRRRK
jgi:hypothetical protein